MRRREGECEESEERESERRVRGEGGRVRGGGRECKRRREGECKEDKRNVGEEGGGKESKRREWKMGESLEPHHTLILLGTIWRRDY